MIWCIAMILSSRSICPKEAGCGETSTETHARQQLTECESAEARARVGYVVGPDGGVPVGGGPEGGVPFGGVPFGGAPVGGGPLGGVPVGGVPVGGVPGGLVVCAMATPASVGYGCIAPTTLNVNAIRTARVRKFNFIDCSPLYSLDVCRARLTTGPTK